MYYGYNNNDDIRPTKMFVVLSIVYGALLLISNIITSKIICIYGITLPGAALIFPLVYIASDLMTEVYGIRLSLIAIRTNVFINFLMSAIFIGTIHLPYAPFWGNQAAFETILGSTPRIVAASLIAYYLGDFANSSSLSIMKTIFRGRKFVGTFFFRAIGSSIIGQVFDTALFIILAFYGTMPNSILFTMIWMQYCTKIAYEIICFPILKIVVDWWKHKDHLNIYDEIKSSNYKLF